MFSFSLQRFLSNGEKFFDLLEANAEEARQSAQALLELIDSPQEGWSLDQFILRRQQDKRNTEELTKLLCTTFITPLEREEIEALSSALSRIPKVVKKFAERLMLSKKLVRAGLFRDQATLLERATDTVCQMVRQLRHKPQLDAVREQNEQLHRYETEADNLILELWKDLYGGKYEAPQMIVLRDLSELLEKVIDRCRDAGNVVFQIILKKS